MFCLPHISLYYFISTLLMKEVCCRHIEIVLHPTALIYIYIERVRGRWKKARV